jgi:hypothetical protein
MAPIVDATLLSADTAERFEHGLDFVRRELAAIGQQNQFRRRCRASLHRFRERDERLQRGGNGRDRGEELAPRHLDAPTDFLFFACRQKLASRDAGEIRANEIDLNLGNAGLRRFFQFVRAELFSFGLVNVLIFESLGFLIVQQPLRSFDHSRCTWFRFVVPCVYWDESKLVRPLSPIQHVIIPVWVPPIDE